MKDRVWADTIVGQCIARGIDHFFLAPGSRCTPLTLAIARQEKACVVQHYDERGLAFAVLGFGRSSGRPGVFVCTSGTAVANAYPAVIEAANEGVPMLLFTADRPDELRGTGANQTIDQREIFGSYPRLFLHMSVPEDLPDESEREKHLLTSLERCFEESRKGPVHANWMFREPFSIEEGERVTEIPAIPDLNSERRVLESTGVDLNGDVLITLGNCQADEARAALALANKLACPMLADITSGLRTGSLELPTEFSLPVPDTILHLGGRVVSKSYLAWSKSVQESGTKLVHLTPTGQTFNPNQLPQLKMEMPLVNLVSRVNGQHASEAFRQPWQASGLLRDQVIHRELADATRLTEPAIAFHLLRECPEDHGLFVGNSMPIRDLDWYGVGGGDQVRFVDANRGASGIDGLIATATGFSTGLQKPTTVVLGDLSALHDLNSLAMVAKSRFPIVVVIVNNQGGHIFDQLPIRQSQHFEQFFATPHDLQFEHAARMFDLGYHRIDELVDFISSYRAAVSGGTSVVLELLTDRGRNVETRQLLQEEIRRCSLS